MTGPGPILVSTERPGRTGQVVGFFAVLGLGGVAVLSPFLSFIFVSASASCFEGDDRFICTADGQQFVGLAPTVGAVLGLLLALPACLPRSRLRPVWLLLGYATALTGALIGYGVASAGS